MIFNFFHFFQHIRYLAFPFSCEEYEPIPKTLNGQLYLATNDDRIYTGIISDVNGILQYILDTGTVGYSGTAQLIVHIEYQIDLI